MIHKFYEYDNLKYWIQSECLANVRGVLQDLYLVNVWFYYWGPELDHIRIEL